MPTYPNSWEDLQGQPGDAICRTTPACFSFCKAGRVSLPPAVLLPLYKENL